MENRNTFVLGKDVFMKITLYPTLFEWFIQGVEINVNVAINLHLPVECCAGAWLTVGIPTGVMDIKEVNGMGKCTEW